MTAANRTLLVAGLGEARYALDVRRVREMVRLPALSPVDEMPRWITGIFDLRGDVVPVLDLALRFGRRASPPAAGDGVVVLEDGDLRIGLRFEALHDVISVSPDDIRPVAGYELPGGVRQFVGGVVARDGELVMLLEPDALIREADVLPDGIPPPADGEGETGGNPAGPAAEEALRRARELAQPPAPAAAGIDGLHVVAHLAGECFALPAPAVREFAHRRRLVPIPGSPRHVAGAMNLRGEILTVIDLAGLLGLPAGPAPEVAVLESAAGAFGVLFDAVDDVVGVAAQDILPLDESAAPGLRRVIAGTLRTGGCLAGLLDPGRLLDAAAQPG